MQTNHGYRTMRTLVATAGAAWLAATAGALAAGYAWNSTANGNWSDTTKWTPAGYPATAADTAVFSQNLGANPTITMDVPATVSGLTLTDTTAGNGWMIAGSNTLTLAGAAAVSASGSSVLPYNLNPHTISAPIAASVPLTLNLGANGGLVLSGNNASLTGGVTVNGSGSSQAYVRFGSAASLGGVGNTITVAPGAQAVIGFSGLTQTDLNRFAASSGLLSFWESYHVNGPAWGTPVSPAANLNLTGFNEYFRIGAGSTQIWGDSTTISGTFTPPSNTFRFGGGGGRLTVDSVFADGAAARAVEISGTEILYGSLSLVALTKANTYTGPTEVRNGVLRLAGTSGSALNTSAFNVRYNAFFELDAGLAVFGWANETGAVVGNNNNRVGDTTPVNLYGATLNFFGNPDTGTTETIGALNAQSGLAKLDARWKTGNVTYDTVGNVFMDRGGSGTGAAVLTAQSLNLNNGAHLWLRGVNVGAAGTSATRVMLNSAPATVGGAGAGGSTTISILPGVFYTTGLATSQNSGTNHWVMYDATNGLRGLVAGEYSTLTSGENSNNNAVYQQTGAGSTLTLAATTVNSAKFQFDLSSGTMTIGGTGPLTLKSGNLLVEGNPTGDGCTLNVSVPLDLNGRQGNVVYMTDTFTGYALNSVMSNTGGNGVSFSAFNTALYQPQVSLGGASTYTGPTSFNAGLWQTSGNERIPDTSDLRIRAGAKLTLGSGSTETVASLAGGGTLDFGSTSSKMVVGSGTATNQSVVVGGGATTGAVTPGDSAGTLTVGSATQNVHLVAGANAIFNFELGLADLVGMGVNDLIAVNGNLTLAGTLNITAMPGFGPAPGKGWGTYTLFTYTGSLTGSSLTMGTAPAGYGYVFNAGGGVVNLVVPEPVSGLLFGLAALGLLRRRYGSGG